MAYPLIPPKSQWVDANGDPLVGGYLEFVDPSTGLAKDTYPTADGADAQTNPNSNPVVLDSRGEAAIFLEDGETYKVTLYDADDVQLWTVDDVAAAAAPDASQVTITDSGGYYAASNVEAALQELGAATGGGIIGIADGGGYYSSTDVEGALQELGPLLAGTTDTEHIAVRLTGRSFNNTTTFSDISFVAEGSSQSSLTLSEGGWVVTGGLILDCGLASPGFKLRFTTGDTLVVGATFSDLFFTAFSNNTTHRTGAITGATLDIDYIIDDFASSGVETILRVEGSIDVTTTGGLKIQGAQNDASATSTVLEGGMLLFHRVNS